MNDPGEGQLPDAPQVELSTPPQIEISESAEQETPIFSTPAWHPFQERIPHIGHVFLLFLLLILGVVGASLVTVTEVRFHLFGLASMKDVAGNARVALIAQGSIYLIAFALSLLLFPPLWNQGFFAGIEWNGRKALSLFKRLFASAHTAWLAAVSCIMLSTAAAWSPKAFVTLAGFCWFTSRMIFCTSPAFIVKPTIPHVSSAPSKFPMASVNPWPSIFAVTCKALSETLGTGAFISATHVPSSTMPVGGAPCSV